MAELLERWPAAVGAAIARNAWPARIARDGTVHVNTADSVWAFELGQRAGEIARAWVSSASVRAGTAPGGRARSASTSPLEPTPEDDERARALAAGIADEKLRESVQKAVSLSLAQERRRPPDLIHFDGASQNRCFAGISSIWRRHRRRPDTRPRTSPCSRASSRSVCARGCTSARPASAASTTSSRRSSTTRSTRRSRATTTRSRSRSTPTTRSPFATAAAASPST